MTVSGLRHHKLDMQHFFKQLRQKSQQTQQIVQWRAKMDPRCLDRPQEDDNRPGTSQEDPHKTQDREKKKRKCHFSAEEQEILVKEVTEHQHQLFVTSKLPISRREAIWQQIVDKINSVAEVRRTVNECMKRWHDCKRKTKEKMARNKKAALQTGGGSPAPQEALDHMEEMVAAFIPEEIVTGIQGQDSADYQETTQMQGRWIPCGYAYPGLP
ncbi:myb-related transcription factor, partner of profilin-like [Pleurodeles waltl]|uniref:myb-related transcription factor, partner of profilin-like n=1 Tax=Pleurodeles waltl TaxID=8319 RepID=UPI0037096B6F